MQYNILLVDDDVELNLFICELLKKEGFIIHSAKTASEAIALNQKHDMHLILLDINLPDANGKDIINLLRKDKTIPIIALTGQTSDYDLIVGLELGMDDYIGKPFNPRELIARIRAVLRRTFPKENFGMVEETYIFKNFRLLPARRKLFFNDKEVHLTTTEFDYLWLFVRSPHRVLPREEILEQIHQNNLEVVDRSVDVTVMRLRRKIEDCSSLPNIIKTIRGIGYVFDEDVEKTHI